jgi:hypothetical protein
MKTSRILIIGAFGLLLSITVPSCTTGGNSAHPAGASAPEGSSSPQVSLTKFFNADGIVPDGVEFNDGLDGDGFACSSNLLGDARSWNGAQFQLGTANKDANVVACNGQTIPLPAARFSKLEMLATGVNGAQESQNFIVTYADTNLNQTFTQSLSDWFSPDSNSGESQAVTMDYRDQSDGTKDDNTYYIYGYSFSLTNGSVNSLILPDNNNVKIFAITLVP